jgi:hypothetical protein
MIYETQCGIKTHCPFVFLFNLFWRQTILSTRFAPILEGFDIIRECPEIIASPYLRPKLDTLPSEGGANSFY